jgi:hypothetical protein
VLSQACHTAYHAMVLLKVQVGGVQCLNAARCRIIGELDGKGRGGFCCD